MKLDKQGSSRQIGRLAERMAAYIPQTLVNRLLHGEELEPGQARRFKAATLFCDISGFSHMANELAADGPRGAEELNRVLLMTFTAMINAIHNAGGVVSHFHGDAMMIYIPDDGQAAVHALACAQFMQNLLQQGYNQALITRSNNQPAVFNLSMRVGVGYGECLEVVVGDLAKGLECVVAGSAIDDAVEAEKRAQAGQVMASQRVLAKANLPTREPFGLVTEVLPVPYSQQSLHWDAYAAEQLWRVAEIAAAFVPRALHDRIMTDNSYFVAEHRPVTSLFVRFEGINYGRADAHDLLQQYYVWACQLVARYGGENSRVNRILTGDKGSMLHIIFGAPVAPEAPGQALRCALALQREKPSFITSQQIGVTTGQAFACAVGSQTRREYTVVGEIINLSSRLTDLCAPNQVLTDGETAHKAQEQIVFTSHGAAKVKGFAQPVALFEATAVRHSIDQLRLRFDTTQRPLTWRKTEQEQLHDLVQKGLRGHGVAVAIYGLTSAEPTRFVGPAIYEWLDKGGHVFLGLGQHHLREIPFSPWLPIWRDFFGLQPEQTVWQQQQHIERKLRELGMDAPDWRPWGRLLGLEVVGEEVVSAVETRIQQAAALMQYGFTRLAARHPILIVLENIHWADQESLSLLRLVVEGWRNHPIVILLTFAAGSQLALDQLPPATVTIPLAELPVPEGVALVQGLVRGLEIPPVLLRHLGLHNPAGLVNPLFLEESIHMMLEKGVVQLNGYLVVDEEALVGLKIPESVQSLLLSRLDRISAEARTLLQASAVIGRQFDRQTLQYALMGLPVRNMAAALEELIAARLIRQVVKEPPTYIFQDEAIQEVVYESIPYARRQRWHASVADWLVATHGRHAKATYPLIAYHYGRTDLHERGLEFALGAADEAFAQQSAQSALELYGQAEMHLAALPNSAALWVTAVHIWLRRGELLRQAGKFELAINDARQAARLAREQRDALRAALSYNLLARLLVHTAACTEALELTGLITHGLANHIPLSEVGHALVTQGEAQSYLGQFVPARASFGRALDLFTQAEDHSGLIRTHIVFGYEYASMLGDWVEARRHLENAQRLLSHTSFKDALEVVRLWLGLAQLELRRGSRPQAEAHLATAAHLLQGGSINWWRPTLLYYQAIYKLGVPEVDGARRLLEEGQTAVQEGGNPDYLPLILLDLAHLAPHVVEEHRYLTRCAHAAEKRARYLDRLHCLQVCEALIRPSE